MEVRVRVCVCVYLYIIYILINQPRGRSASVLLANWLQAARGRPMRRPGGARVQSAPKNTAERSARGAKRRST